MLVSPTTVHPELVEGLNFSCKEKGQGFDRLSPYGF
jgi:hypothetical protein